MRITLLGTGTSQGVPLIGHPNEGLDLSEPKNWRNRSCAHIVSDDAHIQIDAGPEFRLACLKFRVDAVDFFFLTHGHSDHILGMDDLRRFCDLRGGAAIPVWTTPEGKARVEAIFPYGIRPRSERGYVALEPRLAEPDTTLACGTRVQTTPLPHGPRFRSLGLVFTEKKSGRRIAYFTDCSEVPDASEFRKGARGRAKNPRRADRFHAHDLPRGLRAGIRRAPAGRAPRLRRLRLGRRRHSGKLTSRVFKVLFKFYNRLK